MTLRYHPDKLLQKIKNLAKVKRSPRIIYLALAKVHDLASDTNIGYIGNISTGGFMLFANQKLPDQVRRIFTIDFPHPVFGQTIIQVGVRVVWQARDFRKARQQSAGLEILAIEPEDRLTLLQSAKAFGFAA